MVMLVLFAPQALDWPRVRLVCLRVHRRVPAQSQHRQRRGGQTRLSLFLNARGEPEDTPITGSRVSRLTTSDVVEVRPAVPSPM